MKINMRKITIAIVIFVAQGHMAWSQGFVNLNFESPILPLAPDGGFVQTANAIPGWTAYLFANPQTEIGYNAVSIGGSIITLNDTNASGSATAILPIQGKYSVVLYASQFGPYAPAAIGQTGEIPPDAQSLTFFANLFNFVNFVSTVQVTFNGQPINYLVTGSTANYNIYAADISAYAGQTGELLFTATSPSLAILDNIQFSSTAVPEPSTFGLAVLGALVFGLAKKRQRQQF
jgi:hypothetical protein